MDRPHWLYLIAFLTLFQLGMLISGCSDYGTTAIENVHLVPMTTETIVRDQTVLVKGDRIVKIGATGSMTLPGDCTIIDGQGAYLIPGLADMHIHTRDDWQSEAWPVSPLALFLANGVTTIRDFGPKGKTKTFPLHWREETSRRELDGPWIYTSGEILYASPAEDAAGLVRRNQAQGFDFQKIYSYVSPGDFKAAMTTAKELKFYTAGHIPFQLGLAKTLFYGLDEIAHIEELDFEFISFDRNKHLPAKQWLPYVVNQALHQYDMSGGFNEKKFRARFDQTLSDIIQRIKAADTPVCTTLSVGDTIVQKLFQSSWFSTRPESKYMPKAYWQAFKQGREKHQLQFRGVESLALFKYELEKLLVRELHRAGITLVLSTDCGTGRMGIVPGFSIHDELRILVENGLSPYEALYTGTVNAAQVVTKMGGRGDFGVVAVGKRADLVLAKDNPLENISALKNIQGVMAAGKWYDKSKLEKMTSLTRR